MKKNLSICMTTFNRSMIMTDCLKAILTAANKYSVKVYVSDNCSTDDTVVQLKKLKNKFSNLEYFVQDENKGFDINLKTCIDMAESAFVWVMGDYSQIEGDALETIFSIIEKYGDELGAAYFNNYNRLHGLASQEYSNVNNLLKRVGWHITLLDTVVINKKILEDQCFKRYERTMFAYFGYFIEALCLSDKKILWIDKSLTKSIHKDKESLWVNKTFTVWSKYWVDLVMSLPPQISVTTKQNLIRDHSHKSGIFSIKSLLNMRDRGILSTKILQSVGLNYLYKSMGWRIIPCIFLALIPKLFINLTKTLYLRLRIK